MRNTEIERPVVEASIMFYSNQTLSIEKDPLSLAIPTNSYVLVVDDDNAILSVVMLLLGTEGYSNLGISNSQKVLPFLEQIQVVKARFPSVILLDLMMPVISGYEIAAELSKHEWSAHIPIVIMTADHRMTNINMVPGATDWMSKPFRIEVLLNKLERHMPPALIG